MLSISNLNLAIGGTPILRDVSLSLEKGRILGIVGESGSGKSLTSLSIMQLLPHGSTTSGSIRFNGEDLLNADEARMQALRGDDIGMVFQEPMTALNPVHTISDQITEGIMLHRGTSRSEAKARTATMLERVGLLASHVAPSRFPHELSGGQRQRVMIAMACALDPALLIADEPTTALDVTLQAQILDLLKSMVHDTGMGLVLISHDLAVVAEMADDIIVMKDGEVVDRGTTVDVLSNITHPYTAQLAEASSHRPERKRPAVLSEQASAEGSQPIVSVRDLVRDYPTQRESLFRAGKPFRALKGVGFDIFPGQSTGLVGESGCGKSTLARIVLGLDRPTSGTVTFQGEPLDHSNDAAMREARKSMQVVFQDPFASFNPRHRIARSVAEPLYLEGSLTVEEKRLRVAEVLGEVGIEADAMDRYPHEFSGGQRQRLAIARALITRPALIVADEPVSALDVSIRAKVLDLLADLRDRLGIAFLFISHDLGVVRALCEEVMVMDAGEIVERGEVGQVFNSPQSSAAKSLVEATPDLERALAMRLDMVNNHPQVANR